MSQPELTGEQAYQRVVDTFSFEQKRIDQVTYATSFGEIESLMVTDYHPFFVRGFGWRGVAYLHIGDVLELADRSHVSIIEIQKTDLVETVYNFTGNGFSTYYVGEMDVWVHNEPCPVKDGKAEVTTANGGATDH